MRHLFLYSACIDARIIFYALCTVYASSQKLVRPLLDKTVTSSYSIQSFSKTFGNLPMKNVSGNPQSTVMQSEINLST